MERSSDQPGRDGVPAEMSAREDRYKEYLKEKRTEANRLKQRRLRGKCLSYSDKCTSDRQSVVPSTSKLWRRPFSAFKRISSAQLRRSSTSR